MALTSDFSGENHQEALKIVYQLAKVLESDLRIVYVHEDDQETASREVKQNFEKIFSLIPHSYYEIENKNIVNGLIDFCKLEDIDMLITLRDKHRSKEKLMSGSISKSLSLRGEVPLMVIPVAD